MKKILVPMDFSKFANYALEFAAQLTEKTGGEILMTHILDFPAGNTYSMMGEFTVIEDTHEWILNLHKEAESKFEEIMNDSKYSGVKLTFDIKTGNPFESIAKSISKYEADLVIIGTKGCSGIEEIVIGSNAEKVVRFTKCPVISVPNYFDISSVKRIVFGIDPDHCPDLVVEKLVEYQKLLGAEIKFVWINTVHVIESEEVMKDKIKEIARRLNVTNYTVDCFRSVLANNGIIQYASEMDADMIALPTHGRRGLAHLFTGSLAEDVVNHAKCPVWTMNQIENN